MQAGTVTTTVEENSRRGTKKSQDVQEDKFFWAYTEEPHRTRRQAIIQAHPEVNPANQPNLIKLLLTCNQVLKLCGPEALTKYVVLGVVSLQLACAIGLRNTPIFSIPFLLTAYLIGATANQNLFLAIHEISHNLAFKSPILNRILAVFANLPIGIPYSAAFRVCVSSKSQFREKMTDSFPLAIPPNPPQIPRRRWPRHRPPHQPRSLLPRLHPRESLLLHLPNPLLCSPPHDGLQTPLYNPAPL